MAPKMLPARAVLPVVRPQTFEQTCKNIQTAIDAKAAGAFIINRDIGLNPVIQIFRSVREVFPDFWLGVNLFGLSPSNGIASAAKLGADGYQSDNAHADDIPPTIAEVAYAAKHKLAARMVYFGGVDFKGQPAADGLERTTKAAAWLMDVITTSGTRTGKPAPIEKIRLMRRALPAHKLALASGVSMRNIDPFLPLVDYFLVGSSISPDWANLDWDSTAELVGRVNHYRPSD